MTTDLLTPLLLRSAAYCELLNSQSIAIGVEPCSIVDSPDCVELYSPLALSLAKKSMPGWMLSIEPPVARAAAHTAQNAAFAAVGSPLMATFPLYAATFAGLTRSANEVGQAAGAIFDASQAMVM